MHVHPHFAMTLDDYERVAQGSRASINNADFYRCLLCGACVIDRDGEDTSRARHRYWHNHYLGDED